MEFIEIITLIDITNTQATRPNQGTQLEIDQERNFVTLKQCIELRSIIDYNQSPVVDSVDIKGMGFGNAYKGKHTIWTFKFSPDREGVYQDEHNNMLGLLINDLHNVPIVKKLSESINIDRAIFDVKDSSFKNTIIKSFSTNN